SLSGPVRAQLTVLSSPPLCPASVSIRAHPNLICGCPPAECGCTKALTRRGGSPRRAGMTVGNAGRKTRARRVVGVPRRARTSAGIRPGHTDAFIFGGHDIGVVSAPSLIDIEVEGLRQVVEGHV